MPRKGSKVAKREIVASGKHLSLVREGGWEYATRPHVSGIVVIVAVTGAKKIVLIEQYRPPVKAHVIELPAGLAGDVPGEEHEELATAARRELLEETGYQAKQMELVAVGPPSAGMTDEVVTFFRASGLRKTGDGGGDASEDIQVHLVPLAKAPAWLAARAAEGKMIDAKIYAGLYFAGHFFAEQAGAD
jgi:ADP-ribose pyrophosphatase